MVAAYQFNNQLKAQESDLLSTQEQIPQAYSGFMPQAGFNASTKRADSNNPYHVYSLYIIPNTSAN